MTRDQVSTADAILGFLRCSLPAMSGFYFYFYFSNNACRNVRGEPLTQEVIDFRPDTILAADCVYFEPAFPLLLQTLRDFLALCPSATIYFCFKKRRRADMHFLAKAKKMFHVTEIEDDDRPNFSREGLFLYTFTARATAIASILPAVI